MSMIEHAFAYCMRNTNSYTQCTPQWSRGCSIVVTADSLDAAEQAAGAAPTPDRLSEGDDAVTGRHGTKRSPPRRAEYDDRR